jgi:hypothetical protein
MGHAVGGDSVACTAQHAQVEATDTSVPDETELTSEPDDTELKRVELPLMLVTSAVLLSSMSTSPASVAFAEVMMRWSCCAAGSRSKRQMGQNLRRSAGHSTQKDLK